jgi:hypothetical protein
MNRLNRYARNGEGICKSCNRVSYAKLCSTFYTSKCSCCMLRFPVWDIELHRYRLRYPIPLRSSNLSCCSDYGHGQIATTMTRRCGRCPGSLRRCFCKSEKPRYTSRNTAWSHKTKYVRCRILVDLHLKPSFVLVTCIFDKFFDITW